MSRVYSAPQLLRAGLRSFVKREKISPVLQTTYNSQMWPLETISLDRVSLMRRAKTPTLRFGTLDASLQVGQWLIVPESYTCICYSNGIKTILEISKKSPEISTQQMFMKVTSFQFLRKINSVQHDGDSNRGVPTSED